MKYEKKFDSFAEAQDFARSLAKERIKHSVKSDPPNFIVMYMQVGVSGSLETHQTPPPTYPAISSEKEKIFLKRNGVFVSNARLTAESKVYAMNEIIDVEIDSVDYKLVPLILFLAGIFMVYKMGLAALLYPSSIFFIMAVASFHVDFSTPRVKITKSNGNKIVVISSNNKEWMSDVASAIRKAINANIALKIKGG